MMGGAPPADAVTLLAHMVDEMRETTNLLRVADLGRSKRLPWWRNMWSWLARSGAELSAGFAVQYLAENIDRARQHWREALSLTRELQRMHGDDAVVAALADDLHGAGMDDVLAGLQQSAIPYSSAEAAAHLAGVVGTIRECDRLALDARSKLMLKRMRDEQAEPPLR
jgi:hypothetical protein